jgi:endogenous inhibitor of DNA gyrase (YacG/DUF329 family)
MKIVCPICNNITTWEENPWRPFCAEKCKLIDLGKWVDEEYKIDDRALNSSKNPETNK